ncbi:hypothetical protein HY620_00320 [Candidatus Uhrbacteria bacterium]|nr:hypothetical protein [Candidatus Uhrbacteria bacterium]
MKHGLEKINPYELLAERLRKDNEHFLRTLEEEIMSVQSLQIEVAKERKKS